MITHQCSWCPTPLPSDPAEWSHHHLATHGQAGWSVRPIQGGDWDMGELAVSVSEPTKED